MQNDIRNQYNYSNVEFVFPSLAGATDKINFGHLSPAYFNQLTKLDEFKIYNKKATDTEVQQMYTSYPLAIRSINETNQVSIYPNPATKSISFSLEQVNNKATASLYSIDGKLVASLPIHNVSTSMNIAGLTKGIYILQINNGDQFLTSKFIKE